MFTMCSSWYGLCVSIAAPVQGQHRSALQDVQNTLEQKSRALTAARQECEEGEKKLSSAASAAGAAKQASQQETSQLHIQVCPQPAPEQTGQKMDGGNKARRCHQATAQEPLAKKQPRAASNQSALWQIEGVEGVSASCLASSLQGVAVIANVLLRILLFCILLIDHCYD